MLPANEHIVYRHLTTQQRPNGDWEKWKGDFKGTNTAPGNGATMNHYEKDTYSKLGKDYSVGDKLFGTGDYGQDEGHFYMECSNQGKCMRATGICDCYEGYTGRACQRQQCPGDPKVCNGHGVCLSVEQLRTTNLMQLPITCETTRHSKTVTCDGDLWELKLHAGDYVKIGFYPPMKISSIASKTVGDTVYNKIDTFTLQHAFPESLPYGTEIWQVHQYDLWDKNKNMACKCDPRYTGFDCSERKCPKGDDRLTEVRIDKQNTSDTDDDSSYMQQVEKQTLVINSESQMLIGHFTLKFEDYFGDVFETKDIPLEVELSVTCSAAINSFKVFFDGEKGLPASELSRGDQVRIGQEIRFVERIVYRNDLKTFIKSFEVRDEYLGGLKNAEQFHQSHPTGSRVYRQDVSKEIREALLNVPNSRIEGVSVEKLELSGDFQILGATYQEIGSNGRTVKGFSPIEDGFSVGDLIRIRSHVRIVIGMYKRLSMSTCIMYTMTNLY